MKVYLVNKKEVDPQPWHCIHAHKKRNKSHVKALKQYLLKGVCLEMCSFTSAVVIVYGEHVDGDDLQQVCAAQ